MEVRVEEGKVRDKTQRTVLSIDNKHLDIIHCTYTLKKSGFEYILFMMVAVL